MDTLNSGVSVVLSRLIFSGAGVTGTGVPPITGSVVGRDVGGGVWPSTVGSADGASLGMTSTTGSVVGPDVGSVVGPSVSTSKSVVKKTSSSVVSIVVGALVTGDVVGAAVTAPVRVGRAVVVSAMVGVLVVVPFGSNVVGIDGAGVCKDSVVLNTTSSVVLIVIVGDGD